MSINSPSTTTRQQQQNEQESPSSSNTTPGLSTSREKRIRKQKQYDSDYLLYDNANNSIEMKLNELEMHQQQQQQQSQNQSNEAMKYQIGDLVWAKVSGHPWWPCIISRESSGGTHVKEVGTSRPKRHFYVEFFGPAVEHAWVSEGCLIEYKGIEAFKTYAQDQVDQAPTKSAKEKLAERFQLKVALTRRDHWETAVGEADEALTKKKADDRMQIIMRKKSTDENEENVTPSASRKSVGELQNQQNQQHHTLQQQQEQSRAARSRTRLSLEVPKSAQTLATGTKRKRVASVANSDEMAPSPSSSNIASKVKRNDSVNDNESIIYDDDEIDEEDDNDNDDNNNFYEKKLRSKSHHQIDDEQIYLDDNESTIFELISTTTNPFTATTNAIAVDDTCSSTLSDNHIIETFQPRSTSIDNSPPEDIERINETKRHPAMDDCDDDDFNALTTPNTETYLIDRYKYAVRHIKQGLSVEEACNKYRISKGALLKCLSGGTAPRGKKTRLTENEENSVVEWLISNQNLKYNEAIHLVFQEVVNIFERANRPNPFHNGKPSMDWWYDFLSRHPQIMASKPDWMMRGKVNDQYIRDVQSGRLKCTKFRRALLSAIQYIKSTSGKGVVGCGGGGEISGEGNNNKDAPVTTIVTTQQTTVNNHVCQRMQRENECDELNFEMGACFVDNDGAGSDGAGFDDIAFSPGNMNGCGSSGFISQMLNTTGVVASGCNNKTLFMMRSNLDFGDDLDEPDDEIDAFFAAADHFIDPSAFLP